MDHTITNPDDTMRKTAGEQYGQVYLGEKFAGREVEIAVSAVDDDPTGWSDVAALIDTAEPGEIPDDVLDLMLAVLTAADDGGEAPSEVDWSGFTAALTSTPADDLPDQVVSAMNAKLMQSDMEASGD
jgi:hypothetical protein